MQELYKPNLLSMYHMPGKIFQVLAHLILTTPREKVYIPIIHTNGQTEGCGKARPGCPSHPLPWVSLRLKIIQKVLQSGCACYCLWCVFKPSAEASGYLFQLVRFQTWHSGCCISAGHVQDGMPCTRLSLSPPSPSLLFFVAA